MRALPSPSELAGRARPALFVIMALLALASCTPDEPEPTADPSDLATPTFLARLPTFTPTFPPIPDNPFPPIATPQIVPSERPGAADISRVPGPAPAQPGTPAPTSARPGVRPNDVSGSGSAVSFPTQAPEWRPPPYPVPLSLHPDDHYWLIRPIPSGNRNYDLEYYPFGNDILVPELYPYRVHHGLDFPNDTGTPILAAANGTVIFAGTRVSPRNGVNYYGNTIIIQHDWRWQGKDVFTLYAHTLELFVAEGDYVEQGQLIAGVGASGEVSGPHLHLEVRIGDNNYFDVYNPALWLAPFEGYGTLAGRFVDERGRYITSARISIRPINVSVPSRILLTYYNNVVRPDDIFRENFAAGDLPAGRYAVEATVPGGPTYRRVIDILPGRTNLVIIQADRIFIPTVTPTLAAAPPITDTETISNTVPLP